MPRTCVDLAGAAVLLGAGALAYLAPRTTLLAAVGPSFAFAAALVLAGSALAGGPGRLARRRSALSWSLVALAAEAVQHPIVAGALFPAGAAASRLHPASYAHRGTFDPLDVLATLLGAALGALLAMVGSQRAIRRRRAPLVGRAALLGVAVAATLATSPPPRPWVEVTLDPAIVCEDAPLRLTWTGRAVDDEPAPSRGVLDVAPVDAVAPPVVALEVAVPGALEVVARRSGTVSASPLPTTFPGGGVLLHARPCDASGRQYDEGDAVDVVALAAAPGGPAVVAALRGPNAVDRLVRLDADANEVASALLGGAATARVRGLSIAPDGTVMVAGWRTRSTGAAIGSEAVLWRWPVGEEPDAGTVLGPPATESYAEAAAVAVDAVGRAWVAWTEGRSSGARAHVARVATDGTLETTRTFAPGDATEALALALDPTGRPTVALRRQDGASGAISVVLHALDADGAPRWERALAAGWGPVASGAAGTVLLLDGPTLHALDGATGATLWTATDPQGRQGWSLAVDDAGAAVVAGPGPFVQRYATDGTPAGGRTFGSARQDTLGALAWSGGVVVGGSTEGPLARAVDPQGRVEAYVLRFPAGAP